MATASRTLASLRGAFPGRLLLESDLQMSEPGDAGGRRGPWPPGGGASRHFVQRGGIFEPMHSARVHGAFSSTVDATTSPRWLMSCSTVTTIVSVRQ